MKTLRSYAFFYAPIIGSASCAYACVEVINKPSKSPLNVASECGRISVELVGGGGGGAREIRPAKKLCYFVFFSRVRDVKFLLVKIQFD